MSKCRGFVAAWLLCVAFSSVPANAHDLPLDRTMNGFVKIEPHQAEFVIRVPLDLLLGVPFPLAGDRYDIAASESAVATALKVLVSTLQLWEGNVRLEPSAVVGRFVPLSDRSFGDYDQAVAGVDQRLAPDTVIGFQMGYLDAHFSFPISSPNSVFSIESTFAAELGDYVRLAVRFIPLGGPSRAMMLNGASGRVALDPPWYQASLGSSGLVSSTS